jgi:uncharacterized iron-regulated membrane protein
VVTGDTITARIKLSDFFGANGLSEIKTEIPVKMSLWERWLKHPQRLWLRKALLQVHLWAGIGFSLYVLLMSVSGTVLIYRVEIERAFSHQPLVVIGPGARMTVDELKQAAKRAYPKYEVKEVSERKNPNEPVEISLERDGEKLQRLFNPFTGADLGNSVRVGFLFIEWLVNLHDNLLYKPVGRFINGIGGLIVTLLCLTGAVIWWPGTDNWRRSLTVSWKADPKRLNWALHSALGLWSIAFIFLWGISGIYLALPKPFEAAVDFFAPAGKSSKKLSFGEEVLDWLAKLHFGRFAGLPSKLVWTVFGLVPAALVTTGILMWWDRVLRPRLGRKLIVHPQINEAESPHPGNSQLGA